VKGFNDWIFFSPKGSPALEHSREVDAQARETLARDLQTRLRGRIDPGISAAAAVRAQAIRVQSEGDRLVIDQEDQGAVLAASAGMVAGDNGQEASSIEQLFELSSGIPSAVQEQDGGTRLIFRTITLESLLGDQRVNERDLLVEQTTTETLRSGIVGAIEEAVTDVARRHPERP
jgi:hypothetical protein